MLKDILHYMGMGYWSLPDHEKELWKRIDKANLYYKWGKEGRKKGDFYESYDAFVKISDDSYFESKFLIDKYEKLLDIILEILRLELQEAASWFNFLCENRHRLELREKPFPQELDRKIKWFLEAEERFQAISDDTRQTFSRIELSEDDEKESRQIFLEKFEADKSHVNQGIEAFYGRVREYVSGQGA